MAKRVFILGGTGQIGRSVGSRLSKEGWAVTYASRGGDIPHATSGLGAVGVSVDRNQDGALARAIGDGADVVIDTVAYDETMRTSCWRSSPR